MEENGSKKIKIALIAAAAFLLTITAVATLWILSGEHPLTLTLAYVAGITMIFLPCTFPLVFIIVPMSSGKRYKKGALMALFFGIGITLTLTVYGIIVALTGKYLGLDEFTQTMFFLAGVVAYTFGMKEIGLFDINIPQLAQPSFKIDNDYVRAFLTGLLLGNAGVGCPNPAFYVMLLYLATTGDILEGASLGFIHGLGRATPLLLISLLALLGINATHWIIKKRKTVYQIMSWALIIGGAFIMTMGIFGMYWWEKSIIHNAWNLFIKENAPQIAETEKAAQQFNIKMEPTALEKYAPYMPYLSILTFILVPYIKRRLR